MMATPKMNTVSSFPHGSTPFQHGGSRAEPTGVEHILTELDTPVKNGAETHTQGDGSTWCSSQEDNATDCGNPTEEEAECVLILPGADQAEFATPATVFGMFFCGSDHWEIFEKEANDSTAKQETIDNDLKSSAGDEQICHERERVNCAEVKQWLHTAESTRTEPETAADEERNSQRQSLNFATGINVPLAVVRKHQPEPNSQSLSQALQWDGHCVTVKLALKAQNVDLNPLVETAIEKQCHEARQDSEPRKKNYKLSEERTNAVKPAKPIFEPVVKNSPLKEHGNIPTPVKLNLDPKPSLAQVLYMTNQHPGQNKLSPGQMANILRESKSTKTTRTRHCRASNPQKHCSRAGRRSNRRDILSNAEKDNGVTALSSQPGRSNQVFNIITAEQGMHRALFPKQDPSLLSSEAASRTSACQSVITETMENNTQAQLCDNRDPDIRPLGHTVTGQIRECSDTAALGLKTDDQTRDCSKINTSNLIRNHQGRDHKDCSLNAVGLDMTDQDSDTLTFEPIGLNMTNRDGDDLGIEAVSLNMTNRDGVDLGIEAVSLNMTNRDGDDLGIEAVSLNMTNRDGDDLDNNAIGPNSTMRASEDLTAKAALDQSTAYQTAYESNVEAVGSDISHQSVNVPSAKASGLIVDQVTYDSNTGAFSPISNVHPVHGRYSTIPAGHSEDSNLLPLLLDDLGQGNTNLKTPAGGTSTRGRKFPEQGVTIACKSHADASDPNINDPTTNDSSTEAIDLNVHHAILSRATVTADNIDDQTTEASASDAVGLYLSDTADRCVCLSDWNEGSEEFNTSGNVQDQGFLNEDSETGLRKYVINREANRTNKFNTKVMEECAAVQFDPCEHLDISTTEVKTHTRATGQNDSNSWASDLRIGLSADYDEGSNIAVHEQKSGLTPIPTDYQTTRKHLDVVITASGVEDSQAQAPGSETDEACDSGWREVVAELKDVRVKKDHQEQHRQSMGQARLQSAGAPPSTPCLEGSQISLHSCIPTCRNPNDGQMEEIALVLGRSFSEVKVAMLESKRQFPERMPRLQEQDHRSGTRPASGGTDETLVQHHSTSTTTMPKLTQKTHPRGSNPPPACGQSGLGASVDNIKGGVALADDRGGRNAAFCNDSGTKRVYLPVGAGLADKCSTPCRHLRDRPGADLAINSGMRRASAPGGHSKETVMPQGTASDGPYNNKLAQRSMLSRTDAPLVPDAGSVATSRLPCANEPRGADSNSQSLRTALLYRPEPGLLSENNITITSDPVTEVRSDLFTHSWPPPAPCATGDVCSQQENLWAVDCNSSSTQNEVYQETRTCSHDEGGARNSNRRILGHRGNIQRPQTSDSKTPHLLQHIHEPLDLSARIPATARAGSRNKEPDEFCQSDQPLDLRVQARGKARNKNTQAQSADTPGRNARTDSRNRETERRVQDKQTDRSGDHRGRGRHSITVAADFENVDVAQRSLVTSAPRFEPSPLQQSCTAINGVHQSDDFESAPAQATPLGPTALMPSFALMPNYHNNPAVASVHPHLPLGVPYPWMGTGTPYYPHLHDRRNGALLGLNPCFPLPPYALSSLYPGTCLTPLSATPALSGPPVRTLWSGLRLLGISVPLLGSPASVPVMLEAPDSFRCSGKRDRGGSGSPGVLKSKDRKRDSSGFAAGSSASSSSKRPTKE